jgi:hypothetical protein
MFNVSKLKRARVLAVSLSLCALPLMYPATALATAVGYDGYGPFCAKGICVPSGYLRYAVRGDGNQVLTIEGRGKAVRVCNWHMDFAFYDGKGRRVANYTQPTVYDCTSRAVRSVPVYRRMPDGKTCGRLYVNNVHKATVCHAIN